MKIKLRAADLKQLVDGTKKFVSRNSYNKLMTYIYLEIDAESMEIKATALDGHRVSVEYATLVEADESFKCYIKPNIPKISKSDLYAELELVEKKVYLTVGENITGYVQPEGIYYDVKKLFEDLKETPVVASVGVRCSLLKDALDSVPKDCFSVVKIDVRQPSQPIVITSTRKESQRNFKIVLPVSIGMEE